MSPDWASSAPRMMFPPPTTTAIWVPVWAAALTSLAMELSSLVEIPKPLGSQKASPESLRRTRFGLGRLGVVMWAPALRMVGWLLIEHLGVVIVNQRMMDLRGLRKNRVDWGANGSERCAYVPGIGYCG